MDNECKHQWVKGKIGFYECRKCHEIVPNENIIGVPGIIFEDLENDKEEKIDKED